MNINFLMKSNFNKEEYDQYANENLKKLEEINKCFDNHDKHKENLGWMNVEKWTNKEKLNEIAEQAELIREKADVFIVVGVGGSNQAARSVIESLKKVNDTCEIVYAGHNLSAHYYHQLLEKYKNKSIYINVIAKNFATLEPGIGYRVLSEFLYKKYGADANQRIYMTGTVNSNLHQICKDNGYYFFTFPEDIGGRFSSLTDVGILPIAVAGLNIIELVDGAKDMQQELVENITSSNKAFQYAAMRNYLNTKGYDIEVLAHFEPQLFYFGKWWVQLFAESEGKENKGIFPVALSYSEDLHSVGQYIQQGKKIVFETFLSVENCLEQVTIHPNDVDDSFDYLNGQTLEEINKIAEDATIKAHDEEGLPIIKLSVPELNEYTYGQLFYFFEYACYVSSEILGVNPFDQPGVEAYKHYMFKGLGKEENNG